MSIESQQAKWRITHRDGCRICNEPQLRRFLTFPQMPFTDEFVTAANLRSEFTAEIAIYWCPACGTAQTQHDVEVSQYYLDYEYTVSSSDFANRFMDRLAEEASRRFGIGAGDAVLEIGSGDGRQLECFQKRGARVLGFEPSASLTDAARRSGVDTVQCLFNHESLDQIPAECLPAQAIVLTYTFDHLPDPKVMLDVMAQVIDPERGVLLIEVHDLEKIISRFETCLFEHEHTIYLHHQSMKKILERTGWRLVTSELLPDAERRGNSLLIAATRAGSRFDTPVNDVIAEKRPELELWETYQQFGERVEKALSNLRRYIEQQTAAGKRIAGYGAGGRGVMTAAMAGLGPEHLEYLCDMNTSFHGMFTPVTHIPVVDPERLNLDHPDEVIVFSYGYLSEIRQRFRDYEAQGGRFLSFLDLVQ